MKVTLYVRDHSTRKYRKPRITEPMGTIYVLRYGATWETIEAGNLPEAKVARMRKEIDLMQGWKPAPKKPAQRKPEAPMLDRAIDTYLEEIKNGRKPKTHATYTVALRYFYQCVGNKAMADISRADLIRFAAFLRDEKKQSPRSAYNKFEAVVSFLKRHDITGKALKITAHDWPQYVETEPEIYDQETLDRFFAACDEDERLLFQFFLMTGCREQEVIYATDRCVDFENCTVSVRHNPDFGWTPKMYRERTVPVPAVLTEKLKCMLVKRGSGGLLFPTASGKPKLNFLDMAKAVAKRAGINPDEVWLHRFRSTFCTRALWSGVDLRTVQDWMGHTDISSTMRYLKPNRAMLKEKVEAIWQ